MKKLYWTLLIPIFLLSCASSFQQSGTKVVWVNSTKTNCLEGSPMQCFEVQSNTEISEDAWTTLMDPIENFDFHHGYFYKIKMNIEEVPGSGFSSFKYSALEVLEKKEDTAHALNGTWKLYAINGIPLTKEQESVPFLEIDLSKNQVSGSASCNLLNAFIGNLTGEDIAFDRIISTKMMCKDIMIENDFFNNMEKTKHYIVSSNSLVLRDFAGNELLSFDKSTKDTSSYSIGR